MANHNSNNISNTHSKGDRVEPVGHNTPHNAWDPLTPHVEHQDMPAEPSTGPTVSHEMAADHPQAIERAVEQGMEAYNQGDLLAHEEIAAMYGGGVTADPPQGSSSQSGRPRAGWA